MGMALSASPSLSYGWRLGQAEGGVPFPLLLVSWGGLFGSVSLAGPETDGRGEGLTLHPYGGLVWGCPSSRAEGHEGSCE